MSKSIKSIAITILIIAVSILSLIAILGVWDVFTRDVIERSIATVAILTFATVIVVVAAGFMGDNQNQPPVVK